MRIQDFFHRPISTNCAVQGVEQDVLVTAEYIPPRREPVCCMCLRLCSLVEVDLPAIDNGITAFCKTEGRSLCCKAGYTLALEPTGEQVEALDVVNARGVSIMDKMYMAELEWLEDHLLAMAKADLVERKADGAAFALQVREETQASAQIQRGFRI